MACVSYVEKRRRLAYIDTHFFGTDCAIQLVPASFSSSLTVFILVDQIVIEKLEPSYKF